MTNLQRLHSQVSFLSEIDKLKTIQRQTLLLDKSRCENDAEHSWHLAMMVMVLAEYSDRPIDPLKVMKLVLVHDIVEIDAGDTYAYDELGHQDKAAREQAAADRIFNLLPGDQAEELRALWDEFEERKTAESQFANTVDRVQPLLHNCLTGGLQWQKHGVTRDQVVQRCAPIGEGSEALWEFMLEKIDEAVARGQLKP